ncbi:MAG: selenoprotein B glycine/betaine/sarcosine/D-proline reductase [Rhodospirillaceae bacterium]|jgi:D-proline reductase (dithiol) PrdB|nr:selenoprotein B glycine/betaine/sarcosine/D-proline reductase [Rhodospirillales bacterium]MBT3905070.1 selenoprotein B glycine/betaine/sarcosine/D-proline reductase [Rhodospirillaceae bacterium]MBT4699656.1 selenoprotein B glycine/betaine/sarcosine/D-proline reductase [Rhodospirillaceae bacterium]MBT5034267.1 selenoprotein B glycine/betaine/sarcosine/D-proline reductase [Rhodospirillaceae bacterium]MBT6218160.1 selenoprotein B glycine/betaine/sarcosine/D-proline reductase [Rhodospirillaceae 
MAHLSDMPEKQRNMIVNQDLPDYDDTTCADGPALNERKVAIITTAGLHRREDKEFTPGVGEYRIIPNDTDMDDLIMSHVSTNFDRTGFQQDLNIVFPIERLRELAASGDVGEVADYHYAFMGATPPMAHAAVSKDLAGLLKSDNVTGVILAGV